MEVFKIEHRRRNSDTSDVSFVSHRSMDPPLAFKRGVNRLAVKRSHDDTTMINPGPPAVFQLKTQRECIDEKLRQWTYGQRDSNKQNKVILMVGESGTGKTTLINTMINHLLRVNFEDQEFYQITEEEQDQSQSQTSEITVYNVFVNENPTSLTIIDTPGYGDTGGFKREWEIAEFLGKLSAYGVRDIDAVCFVMKASQNRLSGKELYIFNAVLSLFGKDIDNNIVLLLTHSDGKTPEKALNTIKKAEIPCRRDKANEPVHFLFNNRQKEKRDKQCEHILKSAWGIGERSMNEFLKFLKENNRRSFRITVSDAKELRQLEAIISGLMERITEKELKMQELTDIQEALTLNRDKIDKGENFKFKVRKLVKEHVHTRLKATSCKTCKMTCHNERGCWWVSSENLFKCDVMNDNHCIICPGKCHYTRHVKARSKYVNVAEKMEMSFNDLKTEYECCHEKPNTSFEKRRFEDANKQEHERDKEEYEDKTEIEDKLSSELEKTKTLRSFFLNKAFMSIMILSDSPLNKVTDITPEHVDFFISRMRQEGEYQRVRDLQHVRKRIEDHINTFGHRFWSRLENMTREGSTTVENFMEILYSYMAI